MKISKVIKTLQDAQEKFGDLPVSIELEDELNFQRLTCRQEKMSKLSSSFPGRRIIFITGK